jgi:hypothetical protein
MKHSLLIVLLFMALTPAALASSAWYVDGVNGSDSNNCKTHLHACKTIGHAIPLASSGDSIMVAAAIYMENLSIGFSLKVIGSGAQTTIVDGGQVGRVVTISNGHVTLSMLTIRNGNSNLGGGINNVGTLTINNGTVSGNDAEDGPGYGTGGGVYNSGRLTINNSTVSGNGAGGRRGAYGGGIANGGTLAINNSTVSENFAEGQNSLGIGGGVYNSGRLTINNSTVSGNTVGHTGVFPVFGNISNGGGGTATLQNSIVDKGMTLPGQNCSGTVTSKGYNLSSDNSCDFDNTGDLNNTDPKLGQLGNYGGPTQTMPLLSGSPAIDAGNPSGCTDGQGHLLKTDQRGKPRPDKEDSGGCDMGAYERQSD